MRTEKAPFLSIVIIGKNEAKTLPDCFASVNEIPYPKERSELIYVDSGSTDESIAIAKKAEAHVYSLTDPHPNAAKARNLGWQNAQGEFILFLDGDIEFNPDFLTHAIPHFERSEVAVVFGRRREKHPMQSYYHRVLNIEWELPKDSQAYCGGDALMRRSALEAVKGYCPNLIAGEEPELCSRFHKSGWQIIPLDQPISTHDLKMTRFSQYWTRCCRTGFGYASVNQHSRQSDHKLWSKEARVNRIKAPLMVGSVLILPFTKLPLFILLALMLRTCVKTKIGKQTEWITALYYGFHAHFQHIPMFIGQCKFLLTFPKKTIDDK